MNMAQQCIERYFRPIYWKLLYFVSISTRLNHLLQIPKADAKIMDPWRNWTCAESPLSSNVYLAMFCCGKLLRPQGETGTSWQTQNASKHKQRYPFEVCSSWFPLRVVEALASKIPLVAAKYKSGHHWKMMFVTFHHEKMIISLSTFPVVSVETLEWKDCEGLSSAKETRADCRGRRFLTASSSEKAEPLIQGII